MKTASWLGTFTAICLMHVAAITQAGTIASWTFETSPPNTAGPITPDVGSGTGTSVHTVPGTFTNPSGNGSAESWNSNSWAVGDYYQFQVSTLGKSRVKFFWDQTRSSSGPGNANPTANNFRLQFSTDGSSFSDIVDYRVAEVTWNGTTTNPASQFFHNFGALASNQGSVYFRLTATLPPLNSGGQSRVDNVTVTGIPEPTSILLVLVVAAVGSMFRKR